MSGTHDPHVPLDNGPAEPRFDRRALMVTGVVAVGAIAGIRWLRNAWPRQKASVFLARNQRYDGSQLVRTIQDGLLATGFDPATIKDKRVLLKPNLVEPTRSSPQMTTHPAMILAAAEAFKKWGAVVSVGEGPGHVRDSEMALEESGVAEALDTLQLPFADLNYEDVQNCPNQGKACKLAGFYFPQSVVEADLIVSLPKMKTHHWMGVTLSLKNMYGTIPGIKYGWPKNVLHHNGIPETVFDINASLPPTIAIVDGITCMEGDGPIMGSAKHLGLVAVGLNCTAVDATLCRIMGMEPRMIPYLQLAADIVNRSKSSAGKVLGPIDEHLIQQRGESWKSLESPFQILDKQHLREMRRPGILVS